MPRENCLSLGKVTSNISLAATNKAKAPKILSSSASRITLLAKKRPALTARAASAPTLITRSLYRSGLRPIARSLFHLRGRLGLNPEFHRLLVQLFSPYRYPAVPGDGPFQRSEAGLVELRPGAPAHLGEGLLYCFRHPIDPS